MNTPRKNQAVKCTCGVTKAQQGKSAHQKYCPMSSKDKVDQKFWSAQEPKAESIVNHLLARNENDHRPPTSGMVGWKRGLRLLPAENMVVCPDCGTGHVKQKSVGGQNSFECQDCGRTFKR